MKIIVAVVAFLMAGCSMLTPQPNMDVAQLKAVAADKNASVVCSTIAGPWGTGKVVIVNMDQRVIDTGGVNVDANCLVGITTTKVLPAPKPAPVVAVDPSKVPQ